MNYDRNAPNLVADDKGNIMGWVIQWNYHGVGEAIVQFFDGSADSALVRELNFPNGREEAYEWLNAKERNSIG